MLRVVITCMVALFLSLGPAAGQEAAPPPDRSATGGAQTLEDIMARQAGKKVEDDFRSSATGDPDSAASMASQLGTLGGASDAEVWRALRYNKTDVTVSAGGEVAKVLVQDGGMRWYEFRAGPLREYGGWLLLGTIGALALFFLLRGRVRIDGEKSGHKVTRFQAFERFSHWLLAGSFILLGLTGLLTLFGRIAIAPYVGKDINATMLVVSKLIHNNVAWAFMLALVLVFVQWVAHNIPNRTDLVWIAQGGGIVGSKHPPAKKFNFGQKIIFWSVIVLGVSVSVSGLSLLFPYELPLFAKTFAFLNDLGLPQAVGYGTLPAALAPQEEMQLAQLWHSIVAFVMMAIILAHIYIGTIGMEGAFDAMGSGEVDEAWAYQHHSIWLEEVKSRETRTASSEPGTAPAE